MYLQRDRFSSSVSDFPVKVFPSLFGGQWRRQCLRRGGREVSRIFSFSFTFLFSFLFQKGRERGEQNFLFLFYFSFLFSFFRKGEREVSTIFSIYLSFTFLFLLISAFHGPLAEQLYLSLSVVRSFVRSSRYGDIRPNLTSSCPTPPNPYIF